jgi:hypothetical protein
MPLPAAGQRIASAANAGATSVRRGFSGQGFSLRFHGLRQKWNQQILRRYQLLLSFMANCLAPELAVFGTPVAVEKGNLERDLLDDIRRCAPAISSC